MYVEYCRLSNPVDSMSNRGVDFLSNAGVVSTHCGLLWTHCRILSNCVVVLKHGRPRILATTEGEIVYQFNVKLLTCFNPNISSIFSHNHTGEKNYICSFFKI
ncbi:hypothetical protein LAZ67_3004953 [Cordylochernes scorpioides]|uniref:Uncharacterized protein n=1 Tax=Cordylochernes scorpioides TaxID=51811 RepID=A0ABY6KB76_9ARAC|nr:hypothetical protein LAZ67_3004953 [Cordylochernes scorpioides]